MVKVFYIIVFLFIVIAFPANALELPHTVCLQEFNYTQGSTLESNLNTVFKGLVQHTPQTGFNTCAYGQIYGLLQCTGDTTAEQCRNCSQRAVTTIRQQCGNTGGGLILLEDCFLRYENYDFFGQMSTGGWYNYNQTNVSTPDVFNAAVESLFNNLSGRQFLHLHYMLPEQLQTRCLEGFMVRCSAQGIYRVSYAKLVS